MVSHAKRIVLILVGLTALALGALGIFLPLLPTTPFVLVAAIAFANSSERLHKWLLEHNVFGPLIENWRRYGAISRPTKILSLVSMVAIVLISWLLEVPTYVIVIQVLTLSVSATFIVTRPLPPRQEIE
ncbi:MAG: YbaN family protein [Woeseiaceae bacterium]